VALLALKIAWTVTHIRTFDQNSTRHCATSFLVSKHQNAVAPRKQTMIPFVLDNSRQ